MGRVLGEFLIMLLLQRLLAQRQFWRAAHGPPLSHAHHGLGRQAGPIVVVVDVVMQHIVQLAQHTLLARLLQQRVAHQLPSGSGEHFAPKTRHD